MMSHPRNQAIDIDYRIAFEAMNWNREGWLKWIVLLEFSSLSCWQGATWFTFGSVPESASGFLQVPSSQIALLTNYGPITYLIAAFPTMWGIGRKNGLRNMAMLGAILLFLCHVFRTIPLLFPSTLLPNLNENSSSSSSSLASSLFHGKTIGQIVGLVLIHFGQILGDLGGPIAMSPVALLSSSWFPEHQRTTATSIAWISNGFGVCIAFVLGPSLSPTPNLFYRLLYVELIISAIPLLLIVFHFPNPNPTEVASLETNSARSKESPASFIKELLLCVKSSGSLFAIIAGGFGLGIASGFSGCLPQLLLSSGIIKTQEIAGWIGFASSILGIVGSLLVGRIADWLLYWKYTMNTRHRILLIIAWWFSFASFSILLLIFPKPWGDSKPLIPWAGVAGVAIALSLGGLFQGTTTPLIYEILARQCLASSSTTAGLLDLLSNTICFVLLFISPIVSPSIIAWTTALTYLFCSIVSTLFVGKSQEIPQRQITNETTFLIGSLQSTVN